MNCEYVRENMSAYLDGELASEVRTQVEQHLSGCDECRAELEELKQTVGLVTSLPKTKAPDSILIEMDERLAREALLGQAKPGTLQGRQRKRRRGLVTVMGSLATAATVLAVAFVARNLLETSQPDGHELIGPETNSFKKLPDAQFGEEAKLAQADKLEAGDEKDRAREKSYADTGIDEGNGVEAGIEAPTQVAARRAKGGGGKPAATLVDETYGFNGVDEVRVVLAAADLADGRKLLAAIAGQFGSADTNRQLAKIDDRDKSTKHRRHVSAADDLVGAGSGKGVALILVKPDIKPAPEQPGQLEPGTMAISPSTTTTKNKMDDAEEKGVAVGKLARSGRGRDTEVELKKREDLRARAATGAVASREPSELPKAKPIEPGRKTGVAKALKSKPEKAKKKSADDKSRTLAMTLTVPIEELPGLLERLGSIKGLTMRTPPTFEELTETRGAGKTVQSRNGEVSGALQDAPGEAMQLETVLQGAQAAPTDGSAKPEAVMPAMPKGGYKGSGRGKPPAKLIRVIIYLEVSPPTD